MKLQINDDASGEWERFQVDMKVLMSTMRWRNLQLTFGGSNDNSYDTVWLIDDVSLGVCRRAQPQRVQWAQPVGNPADLVRLELGATLERLLP